MVRNRLVISTSSVLEGPGGARPTTRGEMAAHHKATTCRHPRRSRPARPPRHDARPPQASPNPSPGRLRLPLPNRTCGALHLSVVSEDRVRYDGAGNRVTATIV